METNTYGMSKETCLDRLRWKLFPYSPCYYPTIEKTSWQGKDTIVNTTICGFGFCERIKLLFTGRIQVDLKIVTENEVGRTVTSSSCSVMPPVFMERK